MFTYYSPLKNSKGAIVGMWFVGVEKTIVDNQIRMIIGTIGTVIILKAINEVTISTNESAEGTSNIAIRAADIMEKGAEVVQLSESSKESSDNLKVYVSRFKI